MALTKTIIYPDNILEDKLKEKILKMVVLGDKQALVDTADYLAEEPPTNIDRCVIWYKQPNFNDLKTRYPELKNYPDFKAFSLSTTNKVADVLPDNDQEDNARIDAAYTKAGLPQYNK